MELELCSISSSKIDNSRPAAQVPSRHCEGFQGNMTVEIINYNGYRFEVVPVGKGWRVSIYPPDSTVALRESPSILEKVPKETVIAEAKKIVDARVH